MRDFLPTTPGGAMQFDGTNESAVDIASEVGFGLRDVCRPTTTLSEPRPPSAASSQAADEHCEACAHPRSHHGTACIWRTAKVCGRPTYREATR